MAGIGVLQCMFRQPRRQAIGPAQRLAGQPQDQDAQPRGDQDLTTPRQQSTLTERCFDVAPRQIAQDECQRNQCTGEARTELFHAGIAGKNKDRPMPQVPGVRDQTEPHHQA